MIGKEESVNIIPQNHIMILNMKLPRVFQTKNVKQEELV